MDEKKKRALSFLSIREKKDEPLEYKNVEPENDKDEASEGYPEENVGSSSAFSNLKQPVLAQPLASHLEEEDNEEFDVFKYIGILLNRKYWFVSTFILVLLVGFYINTKAQKKYQSLTRLAVKIHPVEDAVGNIFYGGMAERSYMASNHYENLKTPDNHFLELVRQLMDSSLSVKSISSLYTVKKEKESDMLIVSVRSPSRTLTEKLANAIAKAYESYDLEFRQKNFFEKEQWILDQIKIRGNHLEQMEIKIKEFKESNPTFSPNVFGSEISSLETKLRDLSLKIEEDSQKLDLVSRAFKTADSVVVAKVTRDRPLEKEILQLEMDLAKMKVSFGAKSRQVYKIKEQMKNLQELLESDLGNRSNTTVLETNPRYEKLHIKIDELNENLKVHNARKNELEKMLEESYRKFSTKPELQLDFNRMERERLASEKIYNMLNENLEETRLKKSGVNREIFQIGQATKGKLVSRGTFNIWTLMFLGVALGIGACLVVDKMDKTVRFPTDIEKKYGIPVLGIIPELLSGDSKLNLDSDSKIIEPYRNLRTNLNYSFLNSSQSPQSVIITSALQGEGKSTMTVNLAICFSLEGKRVLIVDADLRRPSVHRLLDREKGPGLGDFLTGQSEFKDVIQLTQHQGLHLVSAGGKMPNPSEILGNYRIKNFLDLAKKSFDVIFFDSPAIFPVSDSLVLAPLVDGAIVLFRSNYTPYKAGEEVLKKLTQVGTNIIGGILNDVSVGKGKYYYSYYGYYGYSYYHNYYEENPDVKKKSLPAFLMSSFSDIREKSKVKLEKKNLKTKDAKQDRNKPKKVKSKVLDILLLLVVMLITITVIAGYMFSKQQVPDYIPISEFKQAKAKTTPKTAVLKEPRNSSLKKDSLFIVKSITHWSQGRGQRNLPLYLSTYSVLKYKDNRGAFDSFKKQTKKQFEQMAVTQLKVQNISVRVSGDSAQSRFLLNETINNKAHQTFKVMNWIRENHNWLIVRERDEIVDEEVGVFRDYD